MKNIALVSLCLFLWKGANAQTSKVLSDNKLKDRIDSIVDNEMQKLMASTQAIGISIGIYKNGKNHVYHYGETEKGTGQLPGNNTLYPIASISKTFASALLAQAVLEKKVKPEDDVRKYMDGDYPNLAYNGKPVRLIDLTNHRSGLPYQLPDVSEIFTDTTLGAADIANKLYGQVERKEFYNELHKVKIDTVPGTKFRYSNAAVILLGFILERIYDQPFEKLLKAKLLQPLGMNNTRITMTPSDKVHDAKAQDAKGNVLLANTEALLGAGGMKSTVTDMLKYVRWNVAEKADAAKLTHHAFLNYGTYHVGMNWQMFYLTNYRMIFQDGNVPGFSSYCIICPELNMGAIALSNGRTEKRNLLPDEVSGVIKRIMKAIDFRYVMLP